MRPDELSKDLLGRGFDRLVGVFGVSPKVERDGWIWAIQGMTRGWTELEFQVAVKVAAGECRYFPRPKDITERRPMAERPVPVGEWDPDRCPQCRSGYYAAGFLCVDGVVRERMRCACPHPSQRWCAMPMEEAA